MRCADCGTDNREGRKFCAQCGVRLSVGCAACGAANEPGERFCGDCGKPLADPAQAAASAEPAGARKIVTILFADLVGSTALHERLDPESARRFMESYYAAAREAVESHGGVVAKLLGDGAMAVFGIPRVAEDDAIRAVRAGVAMQEVFRALAEHQRAAVGTTGLRVAVNTGEVVVKGETEIIGDPVNVAARLQERARDGDVVVGEATQRLVASQVSLEPLGSFDLKGRAEAVKAYRVLSIAAARRAAATAFVGRAAELARITAVYTRAVETPAAHMAVLLGSPGLGKSRLIGEFARRCDATASVVEAHCDAAGGATFAPIVDAIREALAIETGQTADSMRAAVEAALPESEAERKRIAGGIAGLLSGTPGAPEETFFVVRRFLAGLAAARPVVLVIDDLQWAEPLLLDLVEHLVQWGRGIRLLVLVGARPELREVRSSLATPGGLVSDILALDGLDAGAAMQLAAGVIGAADLPAAVAAKVLATSEGNPLFIAELVRMLVDEGALTRDGDRWTAGAALATVEMPPTIHALLAARIERLAQQDCAVLERAAVVGRHFSRSSVAALLPNVEGGLDARLESLQRAELIERDTGWLLGEPALRFHHVLIRDAAYRRLLKGTRAELHERLASWIEKRAGDAPEHDETIGRHLEEAHRLLGELGPLDDAGRRLGARASTHLAVAGRRALEGDDVTLAAGLLGRALGCLTADDAGRAELALDWCEAVLAAGDVTGAATAIDELARLMDGSERLRAWHTCFAGHHTVLTAPEGLAATVERVAAAATSLASLDDAAGEAKAHFVHALALARLGKVGPCEASLDHALAAARRAGDRRRANTVLAIAPLAALWGPSPVTRASGRCLDVVRVLRITQGAPAVEAVALSCQGVLEALRGRTDAARRMIASARKMVEELGIAGRLFETDVFAGFVAMLEGDAPAAERTLRGAYEGLRDLGLGIDAARAAALLARALLAEGRIDEAEKLSHESETLAGDDLKAAIAWRGVRAEALARRGEHAQAIELARAAVEIAATTDALLDHADARLALAAALRAAGRGAEADEEERRAIALWEAKGASLLVERARRATGAAAAKVAEYSPASSAALAPRRRPVRHNFAVEEARRVEAAVAARDLEAVAAVYRSDVVIVDHLHGVEHGRAGVFERVRAVIEQSTDGEFRHESLAALGDSLALIRLRSTASGSVIYGIPLGATEINYLLVIEADEQGSARRIEIFGETKLGDAVVRLYELYAAEQPEGPARTRWENVALAVATIDGPVDLERMTANYAPDLRLEDHRVLATWASESGAELVDHFRRQLELTRDFAGRMDEVLALESDLLVAHVTYLGTGRDSGGAFENRVCVLYRFRDDGRMASIDCYEAEHAADALARFDELTSASEGRHASRRPARRRLRANRATATWDRIVVAVEARDDAPIAAGMSESLVYVHHPTGRTFGKPEWMASWLGAFQAEQLAYEIEALATLGDSLALGCRRISVSGLAGEGFEDFGPSRMDALVVAEDAGAGFEHAEEFASHRLGQAIVRLYERYAESLPQGPDRKRAAGIARSLLALDGTIDPDRVAAANDPTARNVDHRVFGTWTTRDAAEVVRHYRKQLELAPDFSARFDDVLALEPDALLVRMTFFGTARDSGGAFENPILLLVAFRADGRMGDTETFEAEQEHEALARFDDLRDTTAAVRAGGEDPFDNIASRADREFVRRFNGRDWASIESLAAPELVFDERRRMLHNTCEREVWLEQLRVMFDVPASRFTTKLLATRGERLSLSLHGFTGEVAGGGGPLAMDDHLVLHETDADGRIIVIMLFDLEAEDAAYAELDRRFELGEAASYPNVLRALRTTGFLETRDWQAWASALAPDFCFRDHRQLGFGNTVGDANALLHLMRTTVELAPDAHYRNDHVRISPRGALRHTALVGTRDGGAFESPMFLVFEVDEEGKTRRADAYDIVDRDRALARAAELGIAVPWGGYEPAAQDVRTAGFAELAEPDAPRRFANAATRAVDRGTAALAARDWEAFAALMAPGFRHYDRTRIAQLESDGREWLAAFRRMVEMTSAPPTYELLATRGERLALFEMLWRGAAGDVGPSEIEWRLIVEVNERGEHVAIVVYDPNDVDAAYAELDRRYEAEQGNRLPASWTLLRQWARAVAGRDWETVASFCAEDFVERDHRSLALLGTTQGVEAWLQVIRTVSDLAPDSVFRIRHFIPGARGYYQEGGFYGTREGGPFEIVINSLVEIDDLRLLARVDLYDDDRVFASPRWAELGIPVPSSGREPAVRLRATINFDPGDAQAAQREALARFEELRPSSPRLSVTNDLRIPPNEAMRALERWAEAAFSGDDEAVVAFLDPSYTLDDRRSMIRTTTDRSAEIAVHVPWIHEGGWQATTRVLATGGDRLVLQSWLWAKGDDDARSEIEFLELDELGDSGRFTHSVIFDVDDLAAAHEELFERYVALGAGAVSRGGLIDVVRGWNAHDLRRVRSGLSDDFVLDDHRRAGMGKLEGADLYLDSLAALYALIPDARNDSLYDVRVETHGSVSVMRIWGHNTEGGEVESLLVALAHHPGEKLALAEFFEVEDLDRALARFEELRPASSAVTSAR